MHADGEASHNRDLAYHHLDHRAVLSCGYKLGL